MSLHLGKNLVEKRLEWGFVVHLGLILCKVGLNLDLNFKVLFGVSMML